MSSQLAVESGPAVPSKMPAVGYYDNENGSKATVHTIDLSATSASQATGKISSGVTLVRIAADSDCHVATGPAGTVATTPETKHYEGSTEIVKVRPDHVVAVIRASGVTTGTVYITELH